MKLKKLLPQIYKKVEILTTNKAVKGQNTITSAIPNSESCSTTTSAILRNMAESQITIIKTTIKDCDTGELKKVYIKRTEKNGHVYFNLKDPIEEKILGSAIIAHYDVPSLKNPKIQNYLENSIELVDISSASNGMASSKYRRIGTELIKQCVKESIQKGFKGRIHLSAINRKPPTPFYFKCGFRFPDENKNKLMVEYLKTTNNPIPEEIKSGLMYLPEENVERLLKL